MGRLNEFDHAAIWSWTTLIDPDLISNQIKHQKPSENWCHVNLRLECNCCKIKCKMFVSVTNICLFYQSVFMFGTVTITRTHARTHWSEWLSALEMWKDQRVSGTTGSDGPFWLVEAHCDWLDDDRQVYGSRTVFLFFFWFVCLFLKLDGAHHQKLYIWTNRTVRTIKGKRNWMQSVIVKANLQNL